MSHGITFSARSACKTLLTADARGDANGNAGQTASKSGGTLLWRNSWGVLLEEILLFLLPIGLTDDWNSRWNDDEGLVIMIEGFIVVAVYLIFSYILSVLAIWYTSFSFKVPSAPPCYFDYSSFRFSLQIPTDFLILFIVSRFVSFWWCIFVLYISSSDSGCRNLSFVSFIESSELLLLDFSVSTNAN